jgi:hypothetical protein
MFGVSVQIIPLMEPAADLKLPASGFDVINSRTTGRDNILPSGILVL